MELQVKDKEVVVPGQVLAKGMEYLPADGTYRLDEEIRANRLGLMKVEGKVLKSIPLAGVYMPQKNDVIIGRVIDILMNGWRLDINSPYSAVLQVKDATFDFIAKGADLTRYFDLDDYLVVKIIQVTTQNLVDLTCKGSGLKKLEDGRIIHVNPHKVPRVIGTKGSMISMIKKATGCKIIVGQNGVVWLEGEPAKEVVAVEAMRLVERLAHISGLTGRVQKFLMDKTGISEEELKSAPSDDDQGGDDQQGGEKRRSQGPPRREGGNRGKPRRKPFPKRNQDR